MNCVLKMLLSVVSELVHSFWPVFVWVAGTAGSFGGATELFTRHALFDAFLLHHTQPHTATWVQLYRVSTHMGAAL